MIMIVKKKGFSFKQKIYKIRNFLNILRLQSTNFETHFRVFDGCRRDTIKERGGGKVAFLINLSQIQMTLHQRVRIVLYT